MAGRGPAPKDPSERRRVNAEPVAGTTVRAAAAAQPELPTFDITVDVDGVAVSQTFRWPERTREWWAMWGESPLTVDYTSTDWDFLLDTAMIHARFWQGDAKQAAELRLRVAKFGATPEDRARLRINLVPPEKPAARPRVNGSKSRRERVLRAVSDDD